MNAGTCHTTCIRAAGSTERPTVKCLGFYISSSLPNRYFGICFTGVCTFDTRLLQFSIDLRAFSM